MFFKFHFISFNNQPPDNPNMSKIKLTPLTVRICAEWFMKHPEEEMPTFMDNDETLHNKPPHETLKDGTVIYEIDETDEDGRPAYFSGFIPSGQVLYYYDSETEGETMQKKIEETEFDFKFEKEVYPSGSISLNVTNYLQVCDKNPYNVLINDENCYYCVDGIVCDGDTEMDGGFQIYSNANERCEMANNCCNNTTIYVPIDKLDF